MVHGPAQRRPHASPGWSVREFALCCALAMARAVEESSGDVEQCLGTGDPPKRITCKTRSGASSNMSVMVPMMLQTLMIAAFFMVLRIAAREESKVFAGGRRIISLITKQRDKFGGIEAGLGLPSEAPRETPHERVSHAPDPAS